MINMSPREQAPRTQVPLSEQPSGPVTADGQPDIPAIRPEYAATREEVLDPEVQALLRNRAANGVSFPLPAEQAHVWMREGLDAVWALVLLEMLDQSGPSLNGRVNLPIVARTLGYSRSWVTDIVTVLKLVGMIRDMGRRSFGDRVFLFAKHADMIRLIRQNRNRWRRRKTFGGLA